MKNSLSFNKECPVCSHLTKIPDYDCCTECGWQFMLYSEQPKKQHLQKLQHKHQLKKESYEQYTSFENSLQDYQTKIKDLEQRHVILKERYDAIAPGFELLTQQLEVKKGCSASEDLEDLEKQVKKLQEQIDLYHDKIPSGYHHAKLPDVTLKCKYDTHNNQIEVEIIDVPNLNKRIIQDVVFAVAFYENPTMFFQDADLIIPTISREIDILGNSKKIVFPLKYQPSKVFLKPNCYKIIHLLANSMSEYTII
jgi:hypothetical protein